MGMEPAYPVVLITHLCDNRCPDLTCHVWSEGDSGPNTHLATHDGRVLNYRRHTMRGNTGAAIIFLLALTLPAARAGSNTDATALESQKIDSPTMNDKFGTALAAIGDIDGDGVPDVAVGAPGDGAHGAAYVYLLNKTLSHTSIWLSNEKHTGTRGGFGSALGDRPPAQLPSAPCARHPGTSVASCIMRPCAALLPAAAVDLDGDSRKELVVGAPLDVDGGTDAGSVSIIFLDATGAASSTTVLSSGCAACGFDGTLSCQNPSSAFLHGGHLPCVAGTIAAGDKFGSAVSP